jgi:hypothetical protein
MRDILTEEYKNMDLINTMASWISRDERWGCQCYLKMMYYECKIFKIRRGECFEGQETIVWCIFDTLVGFSWVLTRSNGQRSETIGCEEAEKAIGFDGWNSCKYCARIGCTKVISL